MNVLITGNMGYVGPPLVRHLRATYPDAILTGFDTGYFAHCLTGASNLPETRLDAQYFGDIRRFNASHLAGVDGVVHLAAVSNDPMGSRHAQVTLDVNRDASLALAKLARDAGVRHFVFASSCSIYGNAQGRPRAEDDPLDPLTAYARSKAETEQALANMDTGDMTVTAMRFATACGSSDRLRLDLVLNDFVASAITTGQITVLSDGSPWRPLIDVADMARAIDWGLTRHASESAHCIHVNVGRHDWNFQVRDLAAAVAAAIPGTKIDINASAPPDRRSYSVDFAKFREMAPNHQPQKSLDESIDDLRRTLLAMGFNDPAFRNSQFVRLKALELGISSGILSEQLEWTTAPRAHT